MKARLLLDGGTPKVPPSELEALVERAGLQVVENGADFGIVVGGDGRFSRYGRTERLPLLFVGVRAKGASGSKGFLAETTYQELPECLARIESGGYRIDEHSRLGVAKNGVDIGEIFTDVYLQRGREANCLRYRVTAKGKGVAIEDAAIADGVVISTGAGATGYFSYPDRVKGDTMDPRAFAKIKEGEVGLCHINPTYTERVGSSKHPLRYTLPWGTKIELSLFRGADARLYGATDSREGIPVGLGDKISVVPGRGTTKVVTLRSKRG